MSSVSRPLCQNACGNPAGVQKRAKEKRNSFDEIVAALNAIPGTGAFHFCVGVARASSGQHDTDSCGEGFLSRAGAEGLSCLQQSISGIRPDCARCGCARSDRARSDCACCVAWPCVDPASTGCMQPITHAARAIQNESTIPKTLVIKEFERIEAIISLRGSGF